MRGALGLIASCLLGLGVGLWVGPSVVAVLMPAPTLAKVEAQPARLIGVCAGQVYAGQEEDSFPMGCDWIEPIHSD